MNSLENDIRTHPLRVLRLRRLSPPIPPVGLRDLLLLQIRISIRVAKESESHKDMWTLKSTNCHRLAVQVTSLIAMLISLFRKLLPDATAWGREGQIWQAWPRPHRRQLEEQKDPTRRLSMDGTPLFIFNIYAPSLASEKAGFFETQLLIAVPRHGGAFSLRGEGKCIGSVPV